MVHKATAIPGDSPAWESAAFGLEKQRLNPCPQATLALLLMIHWVLNKSSHSENQAVSVLSSKAMALAGLWLWVGLLLRAHCAGGRVTGCPALKGEPAHAWIASPRLPGAREACWARGLPGLCTGRRLRAERILLWPHLRVTATCHLPGL